MILFDSNILVYAQNVDSNFYDAASDLIEQVLKQKLKGAIAHQNLLEFYSIITNPARVENPLSYSRAKDEVENYINSEFKIITPSGDTLPIFTNLMRGKRIKDRQIFDCYIVATMLTNEINTVYTVNVKDFRRYEEIEAINPL